MKQSRTFGWVWITSMTAAFVVSTGCAHRSPANQASQPTGDHQAGTFTPTKIIRTDKPPVVTLDEYEKLKNGLSYDRAVKIIGAPGLKSLRRWPDSPDKVMYLWTNPDNSNMNAVFDKGKLVQKAQFGLR